MRPPTHYGGLFWGARSWVAGGIAGKTVEVGGCGTTKLRLLKRPEFATPPKCAFLEGPVID